MRFDFSVSLSRLLALTLLLAPLGCSDDETTASDSGATADATSDTSTSTDASSGVDSAGSDVQVDDVAESPDTGASWVNPYPDYYSEQYAAPDVWLCHPDTENSVCLENLDTTIVEADGSTTVVAHQPAADPAVDCFYLYPTISMDAAANSDLEYGDEEAFTVLNHVARLNSICRVYAPVYRQVTIRALFSPTLEGDWELAHTDVIDAWRHYIANDNQGRGVILIGHSQGAFQLRALIQEEIEGNEVLKDQLISAYLIGATVAVPEGTDVGGSFSEIPLCRASTETGCVVSYASFRDTAPPPESSLFGVPRAPETGVAACTNPAALAGGPALLSPYSPLDAPTTIGIILGGSGSSPFANPNDEPEITTPFFTLPEFLRGECVERDGFSYLEITILADPEDPRVDDITGDLSPEWGLHFVDINLAMGDIVTLVTSQTEQWLSDH